MVTVKAGYRCRPGGGKLELSKIDKKITIYLKKHKKTPKIPKADAKICQDGQTDRWTDKDECILNGAQSGVLLVPCVPVNASKVSERAFDIKRIRHIK